MPLMKLSAEIDHPNASPEQVMTMMLDPAFREQVCEATHALDFTVDVEEYDDGTAKVVVDRVVPADVPDFVKNMIGDTISLSQTEDWSATTADGLRTADVLLSVKGQPASMTGTMGLVRSGAGVKLFVDGDVEVRVPFFGKKIEPELAKGILAAIEVEQTVGESWLSGS
jgi:Protein of unknown function (DUF2505)